MLLKLGRSIVRPSPHRSRPSAVTLSVCVCVYAFVLYCMYVRHVLHVHLLSRPETPCHKRIHKHWDACTSSQIQRIFNLHDDDAQAWALKMPSDLRCICAGLLCVESAAAATLHTEFLQCITRDSRTQRTATGNGEFAVDEFFSLSRMFVIYLVLK